MTDLSLSSLPALLRSIRNRSTIPLLKDPKILGLLNCLATDTDTQLPVDVFKRPLSVKKIR